MALDRRMMLSLDDDTYDTLMEFAVATEKPAAAVVREILQASVPQIKQATKMLTQIKAGLLRDGIETMYQTTTEAQMQLFKVQQGLVEGAKVARESNATQEEVAEAAKTILKSSKSKGSRRK